MCYQLNYDYVHVWISPNGEPVSGQLCECGKCAFQQAAQQSVHLTGLCVCPEEWSVDIHGNCSNCGLAKSPRK